MIEIGLPCEASDEFVLDAALDAIAATMLWPKNEVQRSSFVLDRHLRRARGLPISNTIDLKFFSKGLVAGYVLRNAVAKLHFSETFKLSDYKSQFSKVSLFGYSMKTVDNDVWATFRGVSPLWASYIALIEAGVVERDLFPCSKGTLSELVSIAECFKRQGEARTPRSRERALLRKEDGYTLSKTIVGALPTFNADAYSVGFVKP